MRPYQIKRILTQAKRMNKPLTLVEKAVEWLIDDVWWEIEFYWERYVVHPIYDLCYGLRNVWEYKSLIWTDRDWDHIYLYRMLEFKLRRIGRLMIDHGHSTVSDKHGMKALIAAEHAKRLWSLPREDWFDKEKSEYTISKKPVDGFTYQGSRWAIRHVNRDMQYRKYHKDRLFKLMKQYSECWWD